MIDLVVAFLLGLFIGGSIGTICMALCVAAGKNNSDD